MNKSDVSKPTLGNIFRSFDPRYRDIGNFAFIMNRVSGLGLTLYLFLHLIVLSTLARGPEAYNSFIALAKNPYFLVGEFLVVMAGFLHGANGLRIALTSFNIAVPYQRQIFYGLMVVALGSILFFGIRMFGGE